MPRQKLYNSVNPDPIDIEIGKRLRKLRLIQDMSQAELSQSLNISFQQIQKYERAKNKLSVSKLLRIAAFFGVPAGYFIDGIVDHRNQNIFIQTKRDKFLLEHFKSLPSHHLQKLIIQIIRLTSNK